MGKDGKSKISAAIIKPTNIAAQITVIAFTDGRPIDVKASCNPLDGIQLLVLGITNAVKYLQNMQLAANKKVEADYVDKKREYLGPRETINYGTGEPPKGEKEQ